MTPPSEAELGSRPPRRTNVLPWVIGAFALGCFFICLLVCAGLIVPFVLQRRLSNQSAGCLQRLGQQATAVSLYAEDNDQHLPLAKSWMDGISPRLPQVRSRVFGPRRSGAPLFARGELRALRCPAVSDQGYGYAMNGKLSGADEASIADPKVSILTFDSVNLARNASSETPNPPPGGRHGGKNNFSYLDGHTESLTSH